MIKHFHSFVFGLLFFNSLFSQSVLNDFSLYGILTDSSSGIPISNVSISLIDPITQDIISGGISNKEGRFEIVHHFQGKVDVLIEHIGYNKKYIYGPGRNISSGQNFTRDIGVIHLHKKVLDLDLVQVSEILRTYQSDIDKNVYRVSNSALLKSKTGADALRAVPSVDVDIDGAITLRGDPNVTLLVNGISSGMAAGDQRASVDIIPADIIDYIEVLSNPSVDYDPSGMGGIINIVTLENRKRSSGAICRFSAGSYGHYDGMLAKSFNKENLGLSFTGSLRRDSQRLKTSRNYTWRYSQISLTSRQERTEHVEPTTGTVNLSGDYTISPSQSIHLGSNVVFHRGVVFDTIRHLYPVEYRMTSDDLNRGWALDARGEHRWRSLSSKKTLKTSLYYSRSGDYEKDVNDRNVNGVGSDDHSHIYKNDEFQNVGLKSMYHWPINKKLDLQTGLDIHTKAMNRELEYLHTPYAFDHKENFFAGFLKSKYQISGRLKIEAGFRAESYLSAGELAEIDLTDTHQHKDTSNVFKSLIDTSISSSPFEQSGFKIYPGAKIWYHISDEMSMALVYSKRTNRPRRPSINPFPVSMIDEYHVRVGNPKLSPEVVDVLETRLSWKKNNFQSYGTLFLKKINNLIQWHSLDLVPIDDLQYELISTANSGDGISYGSELHFFYSLSNKYSFSFDYNGWKMDVSGSDAPDLNGARSGYALNLSAFVLVGKDVKTDISVYHRGALEVPNGSVDPFYYVDLSIEKKIAATGLSLTLSFKDIFDTQSYNVFTNEQMTNLTSGQTYQQDLVAQKWNNYRSILLTVNYDFGLDHGAAKKNFIKPTKAGTDIDYNY